MNANLMDDKIEFDLRMLGLFLINRESGGLYRLKGQRGIWLHVSSLNSGYMLRNMDNNTELIISP